MSKLSEDEYGTVVCSMDTGEYSDDYPATSWAYLKSGILIKADYGELFHYDELDEDFELIDRAKARHVRGDGE